MARFAARVRDVFLELGGVYVKLGQLLATRPDVVEPQLATELEALLDKCPAEPLDVTIKTIREELGLTADADLPFELIREVGSASFGCVYQIRLGSGELAAIKIQRRDIESISRSDLIFLMRLARVLDFLAVTQRYRLADWIKELGQWTSEELDYQLEARKMTYIGQSVQRVGGVKIPEVIWPLTTRRLLTMEFLSGQWFSNDLGACSDVQLSHAASLLFQAFLYQIFELGYFHADLHKGNLCLLADGRVGVIDFGITGFVTKQMRERHLGLVAAFQKGALDEAFAALLEISFVPPDTDVGAFKQRFEQEYNDWFLRSVQPDYPASHRGAGSLMLAVFRRAYEFSIVIDSEVVRYYRAFSIVDSVVNSLDATFSQYDEIDHYLKSRLRRKLEDLTDRSYDPIGTLVALSTEFSFRASEIRRAIYSTTTSFDSAVARVRLIFGGIQRKLARVAWVVAFFALALDLLVRFNLLSPRTEILQTELSGRIRVGDIAAVVIPMCILALLLGWFGRLLRARAYSGFQSRAQVRPAMRRRRKRN